MVYIYSKQFISNLVFRLSRSFFRSASVQSNQFLSFYFSSLSLNISYSDSDDRRLSRFMVSLLSISLLSTCSRSFRIYCSQTSCPVVFCLLIVWSSSWYWAFISPICRARARSTSCSSLRRCSISLISFFFSNSYSAVLPSRWAMVASCLFFRTSNSDFFWCSSFEIFQFSASKSEFCLRTISTLSSNSLTFLHLALRMAFSSSSMFRSWRSSSLILLEWSSSSELRSSRLGLLQIPLSSLRIQQQIICATLYLDISSIMEQNQQLYQQHYIRLGTSEATRCQSAEHNIFELIYNIKRTSLLRLTSMKYILASYSSEPSKTKAISIREMNPSEYDPADSQLILKFPNIRIICECCLKNITLVCHIASEDYDYCVGCFCQLDQIPQVYSVRSTLLYSLTEPNWLCLDEILLLTAFQIWGFGNWGEVKDYMNFNGSKFNKNEIQVHYDHFYLESQDLNPRVSKDVLQMTKGMFGKEAKRFNAFNDKKSERKSMLQIKSEQALGSTKKIVGPQQNVLGYNSKRKCFYYDLEYDEKAECMLADMEFKDDDTPQEIELKLQIIEAYNHRLDQRLKRYEFTIDHHLLDIDYRFKQEFSADKYQKEAFLLYRPFTRFQSHAQNMETMQLIAKNSYYKSLIQGLKNCRKKIDKEGKIETTLKYLGSKQEEMDRLGQPRKVYRLSLEKPIQDTGQLMTAMHDEISKNSEAEGTSLKIIFRSTPMQ